MAAWFIFVLATMIYWYVATRRGRMVALTPDGVFIRDGLDPIVIRWPDVGDIEVLSGSRGQVTRVSSGDTIEIEHIFTSDAKCRQFRRRVFRAKRAYSESDAEIDEQPVNAP